MCSSKKAKAILHIIVHFFLSLRLRQSFILLYTCTIFPLTLSVGVPLWVISFQKCGSPYILPSWLSDFFFLFYTLLFGKRSSMSACATVIWAALDKETTKAKNKNMVGWSFAFQLDMAASIIIFDSTLFISIVIWLFIHIKVTRVFFILKWLVFFFLNSHLYIGINSIKVIIYEIIFLFSCHHI